MAAKPETLRINQNVPFSLDPESLKRSMGGLRNRPRLDSQLAQLVAEAREVARPKTVFKISGVTSMDATSARVDDIRFEGSMLLVNLKPGMKVYPFVATCGREIDGVRVDPRDISGKYILETIKTGLLISALNHMRAQILSDFDLPQLSVMNPGELESWPLDQQRPLFALLGDVEESTGVTLTLNLGMIPLKSRSGIFFPTEIKFENCHFCSRARCVGRRAAFDPELTARFKDKAKGICG